MPTLRQGAHFESGSSRGFLINVEIGNELRNTLSKFQRGTPSPTYDIHLGHIYIFVIFSTLGVFPKFFRRETS